ncbi:polysaccharide deacetylase family protein [Bordetella sp. LUAb4]|uniref:polysaccharide deacetylase family protein n=1 Tax=Bordetella sp. LUAb4 TaxID=2843195 RepID=UPI001E491E02|nr:polysaccharide deacetylase family protein [Bordetella sp. LUAb4]
MNTYTWPQGARTVVLLTVNFDAETFDLKETAPERMFGRYSYGRYAVRAGFPRLRELFARHGVPATFFVPGGDARRHPELVRELAADGHEIAARGVDLENFATLGDQETEVLASSRAILGDITGTAPVGFRAPGGELSSRTLSHLADQGFLYDATFQDADHPYVFSVAGGKKQIVELPSNFALDDAPIYSARHTHARLQTIWRDEIQALHAESILIPITLNLRGDFGSTRAARIAVLDTLLTEIKQLGDVRFMTCQQLAEHTLSLNLATEPDPFLAHAETLARTKYRGDLAIKPL